ncbi:hypothetical protein Cni_G23019 [Canna indica]|uniref:Reverse transcriptase domain-containing protein n=1 Tax=Canna indica TaxID=4628 RepID=A0AAQ3KTC3_9LILI|nr:hypothetical protein Cni_G23019 [Canna indica]
MVSLGRGKAPGPDGYSLEFFIKFWMEMKDTYCSALREFQEQGSLPNSWGQTNLVFIPKKDHPTRIKEYRPIALCNVAYKIFAKVLVNRLKPHIKQIISREQGAFVEKRRLQYNIIIISKNVNIVRKSNRKHPYFIVKLDLEKAYDGISWNALEEIWKMMNVPWRFRTWLLACLKSTNYSYVIDGLHSEWFKSFKGVRQGDPLSPYMFIMMQELLTMLMNKEASKVVLLNSVVNSMPIHTLTTTWISDWVIEEHKKVWRNFLWRTNEKKYGFT